MKYLSTAERQEAIHALFSGAVIIAESVDAAQTGVSPGEKVLQHLDPQKYGHDLSSLLPQKSTSYGVRHAR